MKCVPYSEISLFLLSLLIVFGSIAILEMTIFFRNADLSSNYKSDIQRHFSQNKIQNRIIKRFIGAFIIVASFWFLYDASCHCERQSEALADFFQLTDCFDKNLNRNVKDL